jgi:hypothetical protein
MTVQPPGDSRCPQDYSSLGAQRLTVESRMRRIAAAGIVVSLLLTTPATLAAQSAEPAAPLANLLPRLYERVIESRAVVFDGFTGDARQRIQTARLDTAHRVNDLLAAQLSSFPLGSSAGGFTWTFEPQSGMFTRSSNSFGPIFAERAVTIGRNRLNLGVNVQRVTFDHLEGKALRGGEIVGYTGIPQFVSETTGAYFGDALDLLATTETVTTFATYGLTNRLDVGVAVPVNHVVVRATLTTEFGHNSPCCGETYRRIVEEHREAEPGDDSGSATGLGDVVVRAKYNVVQREGGGLAAAIDARLPTGDERNLLGIAGGQVKVFLIGSRPFNKVSPHFNVGYTLSGESDAARDPSVALIAPPDEFNYTVGADVTLSARSTVAMSLVGRTLRHIGTLDDAPSSFATLDGTRLQELRITDGADLTLLLGSAGVRHSFFTATNLLITANVLFPVSRRGLTDSFSWMLGFDYSF